MAKMIRKQIYLRPNQDRILKDMVRETGVSEAELIRLAIDDRLVSGVAPKQNLNAWEKEREFIETLMKKPVSHVTKPRSWKREDLYER